MRYVLHPEVSNKSRITQQRPRVKVEVIALHRHGEFRNRNVQHESIFKLPLSIGRGDFAKLFAGVVALAIMSLTQQLICSVRFAPVPCLLWNG